MKEHVQDYGVRKWAGDDLIELQAEPLSALQALVAPYAPCILTGCELETVPGGNGDGSPAYRLHAGYVALKGRKTVENGAGAGTEGTENGAGGTGDGANAGVAATAENEDTAVAQDEEYVKIVRVTAQTVKQPTVFLALACTPLSRAYGNGENKAIAYDYTAEVCDVLSKVGDRPYLTLVADAENPCLLDTLGITKKLNRDGGEAQDTVVKFTDDGGKDAPEDLQSGLTLGLLISRIKKWLGKKVNTVGGEAKDVVVTFTDDGGKDAPEDLQSGLTLGLLISRIKKWLGKKVDKQDGYGLSKNDFTNELKTKLDNFTHPAGGDLAGSYPNPTIKQDVYLPGSPSTDGPLVITDERDADIAPAIEFRHDGNTHAAIDWYHDGNTLEIGSAGDINLYVESGHEIRYDGPYPSLKDGSDRCIPTMGAIREAIRDANFAKADDERFKDSRPPKGSAGGALTGTYPNPTIKSSVSLPGSPTVGTTPSTNDSSTKIASTAYVKNNLANYVTTSDSRLTDSRTPTGTAGGDLTGTYPNPTIKSSVNLSGNPTVTGNLTVNGTGESLIKGNLRLRGSGNYGNKIIFGDGDYVYLHEATDNKLTIYSKAGIDFSASNTSQPFNVKGLLQENGSRVYSPNNKPTLSALGAAASSHSHSIVSSSSSGFMSSNDKIKLDKMIFVGRVDNNEMTVINGSYTSFEKKATGIYRLTKSDISVSSAVFVTIRGGHKTLFSSVSHSYGYCEIYIKDESKNSVDANFAIMVWG